MYLGFANLQERIQTILNYMIALHQIFKLQMQSKAVSGSDISLSKSTSWNIFVSTDMVPDLSDGIDLVQGISIVFWEPSNLDPHTSHLWTHTGFVRSLSCDFEPDITNSTSSKIVVSADMDPDMSVVLNYVQVIY